MRAARVADYKRRVRVGTAQWPVQFKRFSFHEIPTLGSGEIPLALPFVILAGPNGVGKTTILRSLWAAAAPEEVLTDPSLGLKLSGGRATLSYQVGGEERVSEVMFSAGKVSGQSELEIEVIHVDAAAETQIQQMEFASVQDVNDIINGIGSRDLDEKALTTVNYLSRRDYREVKVYEIESERGVTPFFEVAYGNNRYDSRTMGAGELAILFLWWTMERAEPSSLVLIEEPETFLSAASQESFSYFILEQTVEKRLTAIVTSHSPKIINSIGEEHHVFLFRDGSNVKVVESNPPPILLGLLGIEPAVDVVVLVEDQAAEYFLRQILERHKPGLSRRVEVSIRKGEGDIIKVLQRIRTPFKAVKIIGVFDGDQQGKVPEELKTVSAFLPGDKPIEQVFREIVQDRPRELEVISGSQDIAAILFGLQGAEKHDWYDALGRHLGLSQAALFPMLFQLWERQQGSEAAATELVQKILGLISPASQAA